jgi:DNA-binding Lrp family transcriptional regulator
MRMKDVELKLISELMKNSRRNDRELAKAIGLAAHLEQTNQEA